MSLQDHAKIVLDHIKGPHSHWGNGGACMTMFEASARILAEAALAAPGVEQVQRATLDHHCDHSNLNAAGNRCLGCGMWDHQFVAGIR